MTLDVKLFNAHSFEPTAAFPPQGAHAALLAPSSRCDIYQQAAVWHFVGAYTAWRHYAAVEAVCLYQCVRYAVGDLIALDPQAEATHADQVACLAVSAIRMIHTQYLSAVAWQALRTVRHIPQAFTGRDHVQWYLEGQLVYHPHGAVRFARPEVAQKFWVQHRATGSGEYSGWQA